MRRSSFFPGPRSRRDSEGFTAVELMVGITMLGILVLGFLTVFPMGMRTIEKGEKMTVASNLAQNELERIKDLSFDDADLVAGNHTDPNQGDHRPQPDPPSGHRNGIRFHRLGGGRDDQQEPEAQAQSDRFFHGSNGCGCWNIWRLRHVKDLML